MIVYDNKHGNLAGHHGSNQEFFFFYYLGSYIPSQIFFKWYEIITYHFTSSLRSKEGSSQDTNSN